MSQRIEVRRRIWAWDARVRSDIDGGGVLEALGDAIGEHPVTGLGLLALGLVAAVAFPFLLLAVELAVLLVVTAVVVAARIVLRRPWVVEARFRSNGAVAGQWEVKGFRRAGRARDQIAASLALGERLPVSGPYDPDRPPGPRPAIPPLAVAPEDLPAPEDHADAPRWPTGD